MPVLRGKIYFPVLVFHWFRVIGNKRWTGQSDFWNKDKNTTEYCAKENYSEDAS
jgi:hypothetical protein